MDLEEARALMWSITLAVSGAVVTGLVIYVLARVVESYRLWRVEEEARAHRVIAGVIMQGAQRLSLSDLLYVHVVMDTIDGVSEAETLERHLARVAWALALLEAHQRHPQLEPYIREAIKASPVAFDLTFM